MRKSSQARLTGRIQIRILAHLPLHLLPLFFVIEQDLAVAEMAALDFALCLVDQRFESGDRAAAGELDAALLSVFPLSSGRKPFR